MVIIATMIILIATEYPFVSPSGHLLLISVESFCPRVRHGQVRSVVSTNTNPLVFRAEESSDSTDAATSPSLNPKETAVLICKFQNDFASPEGKIYETVQEVMDSNNMKNNAVAFVNFARNMGCQIIHCPISLEPGQHQITHMPYGVIQRIREADALTYGEWGSQIIDEMTPVEGDWIVPKYGMCAFSSSNLDEDLRSRDIQNIIVLGFLTNGSVESTIRTAYERCYNVYCLPECCAACSIQEHLFAVSQNMPLFATVTGAPSMMQALMANNNPASAERGEGVAQE